MTESLDVSPKTTEQNLIAGLRIRKSEAEVTKNIKDCARGICAIEANC